MDKKFTKWFDFFPNNYLEINNCYLNCEKPKDHDNKIPEFSFNYQKFKKMHTTDILNFFYEISIGKTIISIIDGKNLLTFENEYCDYCKTDIQNKSDYTHFCLLCKKQMCNLCYTEKNEQIAINNGSKNWNIRKNFLLKCFSHDSFIFHSDINIVCDLCSKSSKNNFGTWFTNRESNKDICFSCFCLKNGEEFMNTINTEWIEVKYQNIYKKLPFYSLLDWIPILTTNLEDISDFTEEKNHQENKSTSRGFSEIILYNINRNSKLYEKTAIFYKTPLNQYIIYSFDYSITQLLNFLEGDTIYNFLEKHDIYID